MCTRYSQTLTGPDNSQTLYILAYVATVEGTPVSDNATTTKRKPPADPLLWPAPFRPWATVNKQELWQAKTFCELDQTLLAN